MACLRADELLHQVPSPTRAHDMVGLDEALIGAPGDLGGGTGRPVSCQCHDMEGNHDRQRLGRLLAGGALELRETGHSHHLNLLMPSLIVLDQPRS